MNLVERNLFIVNQKISQACKTYGRKASDINLIAVSKTVSSEKIIEAINLGVKNFGENYVQEAQDKWVEIKKQFPHTKLHLIGHLQSNKVLQVLELFDVVQSLDSEKLALVFKKEMQKTQKNPEFFIQVNIGEEVQKSGINPKQTKEFIAFAKNDCGLNVSGLMCVPPDKESASPYFALLNKIAKENNLKNLSMGMSTDFEDAIALNANYIRIGSAIFGARS